MQPIVWRVEHFEEIESTNSYLVAQARDGASQGLVVVADFQSAGRGRLDRRWEAPARSSLLCSILLEPTLALEQLHLVVAALSLSVRRALVRLSGLRPSLKWPNDLIVGDRKIAGVLAEAIDSGAKVILGLGVNLTYDGPDEARATSVRSETGLTIAPPALLDLVLEEMEVSYSLLSSTAGIAQLQRDYEGALATIGQNLRLEQSGGEAVGVAEGIDDTGRLLVRVNGVLNTYSAGDVIHVRPATST